MSHEDIVFNGNTFVKNLDTLLYYKSLGITATDLQSRDYIDSYTDASANEFFALFSTETNPFVDQADFFQAWKNYTLDVGTEDTSTDLYNAFLEDFKEQIGWVATSNAADATAAPDTDWAILNDSVLGAGNGITNADIEIFFKSSFSHFLNTYPYVLEDPQDSGSVGTVGTSTDAGDNFFTEWTKFMAVTAEFDDETTGPSAPKNVDLAAYEQVYYAFFPPEPGESPEDVANRYAARISKFYADSIKENGEQRGAAPNNDLLYGWFIPSQNFDEWFEVLRDEFITDVSKTSVHVITTVSTPASKRVLVIDRILRLLINMIDTLQRISAAQAQRLSFLTIWQEAYTELITDVPQFTRGDGSPLEGSSDAAKAFRNEVNPKMQAILERVRARRSNVQDEAKQLQTTINSTQDAANQQTQMATSLLQQLSTILGQIFR